MVNEELQRKLNVEDPIAVLENHVSSVYLGSVYTNCY